MSTLDKVLEQHVALYVCYLQSDAKASYALIISFSLIPNSIAITLANSLALNVSFFIFQLH